MTFKIRSTLKLTQRGKEYLPVSEHLCFKICVYFWELENCPHKACNRLFLLTGLCPPIREKIQAGISQNQCAQTLQRWLWVMVLFFSFFLFLSHSQTVLVCCCLWPTKQTSSASSSYLLVSSSTDFLLCFCLQYSVIVRTRKSGMYEILLKCNQRYMAAICILSNDILKLRRKETGSNTLIYIQSKLFFWLF